tara:strand:+ start:51 stop:398 length:348 start_codon:yes stop_codon:yes gene_type:complete
MQVIIEGTLPTANKYINAERTNRYIGAKLKHDATNLVAWQCKKMEKITKPADYTFTWYVPNKRSDPDNIAFGAKFVFDGLQVAGKLDNDNFKMVRSITHFFEVGEPRLVLLIDEA